MLRLGFLGPRGTFSQEAVNEYMKNGNTYENIEYGTIAEAITAIKNGEVEEAMVPIENSLEGAVNVTMDMLSGEADLMIKDEIIVPIRQHLLALEGVAINEVKYVLSHPQAIGQCRKFIDTFLPQAEIVYVHSTAGAAEEVARGRENAAAIASFAAAEAYGLSLLSTGIQDGDNNMTRFVVLAKNDSEKTGNDRTSIVFSTEDKPGSLYSVLDIFNLWNINMTRIESRPAKNQLGSYIFFVDIEGHRDDMDVRDALTMVKRKTSFYKFLGSYPIHKVNK